MPDYSKMKNADLEALLKERGLPHTGKKADMVSRLQEDDKSKSATPVAATNEDEIDWDDDAPDAPTSRATENSIPAGPFDNNAEGSKTQIVANQSPTAKASSTDELETMTSGGAASTADSTVKPSEEQDVEKPSFSAGLADTDLEAEIEKRKRRAEKFGIKEGEEDPAALEAIKKLERAKKFNEGDGATRNLDQALPEHREKRRREGGEDRGDFKRRGGRGGRRFGGRGGGYRGEQRPRDDRVGVRTNWMNEADKKAAEARKQRWAPKDGA